MIGHFSILKKSKQKIFNRFIHGIDIETYDHNRKLLVTSIYNARGYDQVFIRQKKIIYDLKHNRSFKDSILSATNLGFDFFGIFYNHPEKGQFSTLFRGSSLIFAKTKVYDGEFLYNSKDRNAKEIKFLDTMNYAPIGVKKAGELLGLSKLNMVEKIGLKPVDAQEWYSMILYNIRDSEISSKFLTFLKDSFEALGATFKDTIASTAMSLFKNKYLKNDYFRHDEDVLLEVMKSYYGGRCEVIKRGTTGELNYYDFCCFSDDTEILTDKGFKTFNEIDMNTRVYSMDDDKLVCDKITSLTVNDYDGEMIHIFNENTDQLVTPNHRIYYKDYLRTQWHKEKGLYGWEKRWKVKEARDIPSTYIKFPNAKPYDGTKIFPDDLIKLASWFITEGHLAYNKVEISQSWNHNPIHCQEIISLLDRMKVNYRRVDRIQKEKKYLYVYFDYSVIADIMGIRYHNSYEMRLPMNFINYSLHCKKILFDELMKGDGCYQDGKTSYVSSSNSLLDDFQILCTMLGMRCSISRKWRCAYVKLTRDGDSQIDSKYTVSYKGKVWCVSVPLMNVVVRRNGKVFISGNSLYPSVMHDNIFPDPNSMHISFEQTNDKIMKYEGCSHVIIDCPNMKYPLLPVRFEDKFGMKVIFPIGVIDGWYTHIELRKALTLGYRILKVDKSIYYTETCSPFKEYVADLYNKRREYQIEGNPMQEVCKLLMNCFSSDTEIWTENGIKNIKEVKVGEKVYSINPKTLEVSLKPVMKTWKYSHKGKMFHAKNTKGVDMLTTMNHRFLMKRRYEDEYKFFTPEQMLKNICTDWQFPEMNHPIKGKIQKRFKLENYDFDMNDWLTFLGWYISEGSQFTRGNHKCIQIAQQKKQYISEIKVLLVRMGFVRKKKNCHKPEELAFWTDEANSFKISNEIIHSWIMKNCYSHGTKCDTLKIPKEFFELDHHQLKFLYISMMKGDGCLATESEKSYQMMKYSTISKVLAHDFSRLCLHLGMKSRIFNEGISSKQSVSDIFRVFIYRYQNCAINNKRNQMNIIDDYDDFVYCVSLDENNTVYAGRNGNFQFIGQSIYGKFAEKFVDRENSIPKDLVTEKFLRENNIIEVIEDYVRYIQSFSKPAPHTIPIWASYVTSYGRLKLYDMIVKHNAYYMDTDSLMTEDEIPSSNELGELKLEMKILEAVLVKPKFYALLGFKKGVPIEEVKIKGFAKGVSYMEILGKRLEMAGRKKKGLDYPEFHAFMQYPRVVYNKFIKFKEALRRHMKPNEEVEADKFFSIEDDKRLWKGKFKINELCDSKPVIVSIGH